MLINEMKLSVNVRLLLPVVENAISDGALRPGDVITARNGKTTEITNTDAEGRLILADALVAAMEGQTTRNGEDEHIRPPALVIDFATLTGAGSYRIILNRLFIIICAFVITFLSFYCYIKLVSLWALISQLSSLTVAHLNWNFGRLLSK